VLLARCATGQSAHGRTSTESTSALGVTVLAVADRPQLPTVSGQLVGGGSLSLAADRGHVRVLNFWGSWCSVCRKEAPALSAATRQFQGSGVRFVGIDVADDSASAIAYMHRYQVSFPSLNDPHDQVATRFYRLIPVADFPSTLVAAPYGKIIGRVIGASTDQDLRQLIKAAE